PVVFQQGEFRFDMSPGAIVAAVMAAGLMAAAIFTYRTVRSKGRLRDRLFLTALRMTVLALVVLCLCQPTLVVRAAGPPQNVVAVLLDDSKSMRFPDWNSQARSAFVTQQFGGPGSAKGEGAVMKALSDRFLVRVFRFSSAAGRLGSVDDLGFAGSQTRLGAAL